MLEMVLKFMKLILRKEARVQTQYFTTEGIATEISQLYILNNKAYDYLLMLMKVCLQENQKQ